MASMNDHEDPTMSSFEEQCLLRVEEEGDVEQRLSSGKDEVARRLWRSFQDSATEISKYFIKSGVAVQDFPEMLPGSVFHDTASAVTRLYADAGDVCSHGIDLGIDYGYQKRNRELLNWLKKKKKCLKREDLVAFLCGVPYSPPPEHPVTHVGVVAEPSNMPSFLDLGRHPFHSHTSHDTPSIGPPLSRLSVNDPPPLRPLPLLAAPPPVHLPVVAPRKRTVLKLGDTQRFFEDVCIEQTRKRASLPFQDEEEELFSAKRGKTCCD